jgi:curved DNA-binding protein CbpA
MTFPDYYKLLEVESTATVEEIKQAYRRLARLYHPDINKQTSDSRIKQINEAYAVLSDLSRRVTYDVQRLEYLKREIIINLIVKQRDQARREAHMTWKEGAVGFVRELKKGLK